MKKVISILLLLALTLSFSPSCIKRTVVPDGELALIFRDAFLANAYVYDMTIDFDSLQLYKPIFDRYGYSVDDVAYTVGSFSKRKSARLSDVVERAISLLESQAKLYKAEVTILDTIESKARQAATYRFYYDSLLEFHAVRDTSKLEIIFDTLQPGRYDISFDYYIDSLDNNHSRYRTQTWVLPPGTKQRKGFASALLRKQEHITYSKSITYDTLTRNLHLVLADSYEVKRTPHVTFTNITIMHTPATEVALDAYFSKKMNIKIFADDFYSLPQATDSLELSAL